MSKMTQVRRTLTICAAVTVLAGCKSDGLVENSALDVSIGTDQIQESDLPANNISPWNRYFVTSFDMAQVDLIRQLPGFMANALSYRLQVVGHPTFGGAGRIVSSHPLRAARLDYALSTGLTGKGQTISLIDDAIRGSHEQFAGKTIYTSGRAPEGGDFHGTAVASVAAGTGEGGGTLGYAPGADLHHGYLNFGQGISWQQLGQYMQDAATVDAIVSNNSWGLRGATVVSTRPGTLFSAPDRQSYIAGLREFSKNGVVVFALQNDHGATSASTMAGIPLDFPDLERNWISVVNAVPTYNDERILGAERISAPCLETARFCMTANGQIAVATALEDTSYGIGSGASFAAPQVSGAVALLAEAFPDLSAAQLRDRLLATADNSFFTPTSEVLFAPGISHGYDQEFGHGFLNLRDALLPIGESVIPVASGLSMPVGQIAISGGPVVGAALTEALSSAKIVSLDSLHGHFETSAAILGATTGGLNSASVALATAMNPSALSARHTINDALISGTTQGLLQRDAPGLSAAEMANGTRLTTIAADEGLVLSLAGIGSEASAQGFSLRTILDLGSASLSLGLSKTRIQGSVMGISVPGQDYQIRSQMTSVDIGLAAPLGRKTSLRFDAEFGQARGNGAGMITDFSTLSYNRLGVTLDRVNFLRHGDVLSLSVHAPVAITGGTVQMNLPTSFSSGTTQFSSTNISLEPEARQIDFGINYAAPLAPNHDAIFGVVYSRHQGHAATQSELVAVMTLAMQF